MSQHRTRALVLQARKLREQDKLVVLLSEKDGIFSAAAPGASRHRNRFGPLFELFTEGLFIYYRRENQSLASISRGDIITSWFSTISHPRRVIHFYLMSEILQRFVPPSHPSDRVYRLMKALLQSAGTGQDMSLLTLYFITWILRIEGHLFHPSRCSACGREVTGKAWQRSDFRGILCRHCRSDEREAFTSGELQWIRWSAAHSPEDIRQGPSLSRPMHLLSRLISLLEFTGELSLKTRRLLPPPVGDI